MVGAVISGFIIVLGFVIVVEYNRSDQAGTDIMLRHRFQDDWPGGPGDGSVSDVIVYSEYPTGEASDNGQ